MGRQETPAALGNAERGREIMAQYARATEMLNQAHALIEQATELLEQASAANHSLGHLEEAGS